VGGAARAALEEDAEAFDELALKEEEEEEEEEEADTEAPPSNNNLFTCGSSTTAVAIKWGLSHGRSTDMASIGRSMDSRYLQASKGLESPIDAAV